MHKKKLLTPVLVVVIVAGAAILPWLTIGAAHPTVGDTRSESTAGVSTDDIDTLFPLSNHEVNANQPGMSLSIDRHPDDSFEEHVIRSIQRFELPFGLLLAGYSRYDDSDPLENDVRHRVYEAIMRSPGTYPMALAEMTQIPRSTIRYHVRILEEEQLIFSEKIRGKQRYFPRASVNAELSAALKDDATGAVLTAIERLEPVTVSRLASDLDRTLSTISYHLERLTDAGLVEQERDSGAVLNSLSAQAQSDLRQFSDSVVDSPAKSYGSSG